MTQSGFEAEEHKVLTTEGEHFANVRPVFWITGTKESLLCTARQGEEDG